METLKAKLSALSPVAQRTEELFATQRFEIYRRTDRLFALLMMLQWLAGILAAVTIAPRTWSGTMSQTHVHVYAAVYLGGLITALPVALALLMPGATITRHVIAIGQMLFSSLLIHLTGGRIETHFHVFGSLAFLAMYRDWRVLITGSVVVGIDHFFRGMFWPQSVYGVIGGAEWRFLEHVAWVAFEDVFLIIATLQSVRQTRVNAERQALLEAAKSAVESANNAKSSFLAHMSHEIRTPMTAIFGCADLIASDGPPPQERRELLATIHRNGEHLLSVLNDILDISKIEAGRLNIEQMACSVVEIVCEAASTMRPRAKSKGLELETRFETPVPEKIHTDPTRLRQILLNLLSNAIKFTEAGRVRLIVRMIDSGPVPMVSVTVEDSGIGLTSEQRERLFQPFTQADGSTARRYGGTGLGLTISKRLAERLGGTISVRSEVGRGSAFTVTIAAGAVDGVRMIQPDGEAALRSHQAESSALPAPVHGRVLLAEDATDNRQLLARLLGRFGLDVVAVENGAEAVERALTASNGNSFDLILMDMQMPEVDGYEATTRLRRRGYGGRIMALTAHASDADRAKCIAAGCDDYLAKPYDLTQLIEAIRRHVESSKGEGSKGNRPSATAATV